jgi:serine protease inhibitor
MKMRLVSVSAIVIAVFLLSACKKSDPVPREPKKIDVQYKSAEIVEADLNFGFELFREINERTAEPNLMISPMSVSYALGMAYNGAGTETFEAFRQVLHFDELTLEEVNRSYQNLMSQMPGLDPDVEFSIANSMWYKLGFQVLQTFVDVNKEYFDAEVREVDFSDPGTVDLINGWIEEKTHDKIRDMLDYIPADAVMYLINAIYFNAPWKYEFDKSETYEGNFHLEDGGTHRADFMVLKGDFMYTETNSFKAVELPYSDSAFSMVVILPDQETGMDDLVSELNADNWKLWFSDSYMTGLQIRLPKFKYEFKSLLNDALISLGMGIAFTPDADFTGIRSSGGIYISRVIHQTFIDVMEEGTEAAAATIIEFIETSAGGGDIFFVADRPFLYVIKENSTGAVLFMGKVGKPEYEQ